MQIDPEIKAVLLEMKEQIIKAVTAIIKDENTSLKESIHEVQDLKLKAIDDKAERSLKWHDQHFSTFKRMGERLEKLENRQSTDEGREEGMTKAKSEMSSQTKVILSIIGTLVLLIGFFGGFIAKG